MPSDALYDMILCLLVFVAAAVAWTWNNNPAGTVPGEHESICCSVTVRKHKEFSKIPFMTHGFPLADRYAHWGHGPHPKPELLRPENPEW